MVQRNPWHFYFSSAPLHSQGLLQGRIAEKCPLGDLSEEAIKGREIREGLEVALHARLPCSVSFTRGQERSVQFAIVGLPQVPMVP